MDDFWSPLSPIDAGLDPGPYPMPDSPSLSASTEQDLSEARVRGTSNIVTILAKACVYVHYGGVKFSEVGGVSIAASHMWNERSRRSCEAGEVEACGN